jgi:hemolysin III
MAQSAPPPGTGSAVFNLPLFVLTVSITLAGLGLAMKLLAPGVWADQFLAPVWKLGAAFAALSMFNCFLEYIFHRYVLHQPAILGLRYFYRQHTRHHALTRIGQKPGRGGRGIVFIENKYPIITPEQHEASFFPWYSMTIFAGILTPLLALLQWQLPTFPWFFAGFGALAASLLLYEILHAIDHWPFEKWSPLIEDPRWGRFWRPVYGFHLRHHAVIDCNESISGFFGLPLADWAFGTCVIPNTVYADGEEWDPEKFRRPRPVWLIRRLDALAERTVQRRRALARPGTSPAIATVRIPARRSNRGAKIANGVTQGIGLGLSVAALTLLIAFASMRGDAWHIVSFTVFGLTLLLLYALSALYHAWRSARGKRLFLKLDRAARYLLIAGTYTPFLLTSLRGPWGWTMFGVIWGLSGAGVAYQFLWGERSRLVSTLAYLSVGWLMVVAARPLVAAVPEGALLLLLAGGLCYSVSVVFHRWHPQRYRHVFWQSFVLGGSACHILAVLLFLLPHP